MAGEFFKNGQISVRVKLVDPDISGPIPIEGTLTVDSITNAVHIVVDDPIDIASLPSITIQDIVNLNVDSLPALTGTFAISSVGGIVQTSQALTTGTPSVQSTVLISNASATILAANANRKRMRFTNYSNSTTAPIFIHMNASPATVLNGAPITSGQFYEPPLNYTGEVRAISSTASNKELYVEEWI